MPDQCLIGIAIFIISSHKADIMVKTGCHYVSQSLIICYAVAQAELDSFHCHSHSVSPYRGFYMVCLLKRCPECFGTENLTSILYDNIFNFLIHAFNNHYPSGRIRPDLKYRKCLINDPIIKLCRSRVLLTNLIWY